jgi:hypothetical protein
MGGVGKTCIASNVCRSPVVRAFFSVMAWLSIGQQPNVSELMAKLLRQLTGDSQMPDVNGDEKAMASCLKDASKGKKLLLVLDGLYNKCCCKDQSANSAIC